MKQLLNKTEIVKMFLCAQYWVLAKYLIIFLKHDLKKKKSQLNPEISILLVG